MVIWFFVVSLLQLRLFLTFQDELEASGSIDPWHIIATATGTKEHPGRQRGVGLEITKTDMKLPHKPRKKISIDARFEAMTAVILDLHHQVQELRGERAPSPNSLEVPIVDSARDSCTTDPRISTLPEVSIIICKYYWIYDPMYSECANQHLSFLIRDNTNASFWLCPPQLL